MSSGNSLQLHELKTNVSPPQDTITRVMTSGAENEYVHLGDMKIRRDELITAFGGSLTVGPQHAPRLKLANPSPFGLGAFAFSSLVMGLLNCQARGVTTGNMIVAPAFFVSGLLQIMCGIFEILLENTFGAATMMIYGSFWLSYGAVLTPSFGITTAYATDIEMFENAAGFYLIGWTILSLIFLICTVRSTWALFILFINIFSSFLCATIHAFTLKQSANTASGVFAILIAVVGWYIMFAGIASKENSYLRIKPLFMPGAIRPDHA